MIKKKKVKKEKKIKKKKIISFRVYQSVVGKYKKEIDKYKKEIDRYKKRIRKLTKEKNAMKKDLDFWYTRVRVLEQQIEEYPEYREPEIIERVVEKEKERILLGKYIIEDKISMKNLMESEIPVGEIYYNYVQHENIPDGVSEDFMEDFVDFLRDVAGMFSLLPLVIRVDGEERKLGISSGEVRGSSIHFILMVWGMIQKIYNYTGSGDIIEIYLDLKYYEGD